MHILFHKYEKINQQVRIIGSRSDQKKHFSMWITRGLSFKEGCDSEDVY